MNRVINDPDQVVEDMLHGWLIAHADTLASTANPRVIKRIEAPQTGKVGIVTGGGSGHEPAFLGYVGNGLVDAVAIGEIFSSPTAKSFLDAMRHANGGAGIACLYGNYAGDNMNVGMAVEMAKHEGMIVRCVVANDDVASAPKGQENKRRGVAGEILMWKAAAAKADMGGSLDEVIALAQKAIDSTRSIGIGLSACIIPAVGKANFNIAPGNMEVGIGHHGEPGIDVRATVSAKEMAQMMLEALVPDLPFSEGDRVAVLVSGLGATPVMEQYILYGEIARILKEKGIEIAFNQVGNLFTSLEMMGVTLTLMKLDEELLACMKHPCDAVGMRIQGVRTVQRFTDQKPAHIPQTSEIPAETISISSHTIKGQSIDLKQARTIVCDMIATIIQNRQYLSEIDGLIGDGDHGINMAKGFSGCALRLENLGQDSEHLPTAFAQLSEALMDDIGGSMGPLYGKFFDGWVSVLKPYPRMDAELFGLALKQGVANIQSMGQAELGDKTLIDTLLPALEAFNASVSRGDSFDQALTSMARAAEAGKNSTKNMQARIGRSARLGARSIGVLDAGATSCWLILNSMSDSIQHLLRQTTPSGTHSAQN
jgi:dihydroxyacetone kinase